MTHLRKQYILCFLFLAVCSRVLESTPFKPYFQDRNYLLNLIDLEDDHFVSKIAESGKKDAIGRLRSGMAIPQSGYLLSYDSEEALAAGNYLIHKKIEALVDTFYVTPNMTSRSNVNTNTDKIVVVYSINENVVLMNPILHAAFTANSSIITKGNMIIDGRDYEPEGTFVVDDGVYGIQSYKNVTLSKRSKIGGNGTYPRYGTNLMVIDELDSMSRCFSTPEDVLGLPPNTLEKYKTQTIPSLPFHGILYYSPEGSIECPNLENSSGVLIVHNESRTAVVNNFNGRFRGIVICDNINEMTNGSEILGAVVALGETDVENVIGNTNTSIRYSSQILTNLNNYISIVSDTTIEIFSCKRLK